MHIPFFISDLTAPDKRVIKIFFFFFFFLAMETFVVGTLQRLK